MKPNIQNSTRHQTALIFTIALTLSTLVGCAQNPIQLSQIANPVATSADVQGIWTGTYVCAQGLTGVRLKLTPNGTQAVTGAFEFFPVAGNPNVASGTFAVTGIVKPGQLELSPGSWITRPTSADYRPVRVRATIFSNPDKLQGNVTESNCGYLEATRISTSVMSELSRPQQAGANVSPLAASANPGNSITSATAPSPSTPANAQRAPGAQPNSPGRIASSSAPSIAKGAATQASGLAAAAPIMTYAELLKVIGSVKGEAQVAKRLTGRQLQVTLRATGPDALMVNPKDMLFFSCNQRAPNFKGGALTATIVGYETPEEGETTVTLDRCGR